MARKIVVLGETGAGKSSIVNILTGNNKATVSSSAEGCTFETKVYPTPSGDVIYDTVGLNESDKGTVTPDKALIALIKLLRFLDGKINLIILVIKKGRITDTIQKNYDLFVKGVCKSEVPVILVVTNCELGHNLWDWVNENEHILRKIGNFDAVLPACGTPWTTDFHPALKQCMDESFEMTKIILDKHLAKEKYEKECSFGTWRNWLKSSFRPVWNMIAERLGWRQICLSSDVKRAVKEALKCDDDFATEVANEVMAQQEVEGLLGNHKRRSKFHAMDIGEPTNFVHVSHVGFGAPTLLHPSTPHATMENYVPNTKVSTSAKVESDIPMPKPRRKIPGMVTAMSRDDSEQE